MISRSSFSRLFSNVNKIFASHVNKVEHGFNCYFDASPLDEFFFLALDERKQNRLELQKLRRNFFLFSFLTPFSFGGIFRGKQSNLRHINGVVVI